MAFVGGLNLDGHRRQIVCRPRRTINVCCLAEDRGGERARSFDVRTRLELWKSKRKVPDVVEAGKVLHVLADEGDKDGVEEVLDVMKQCNVRPNSYIVFEILRAFAENPSIDDFESVMQILEDAKSSGIAPGPRHYNVILRLLIKKGTFRQYWRLTKHMEENGVRPDEALYGMMVAFLSKKGKISWATKVYEDMKRNNMEIPHHIYGNLIDVHAFKNRFQKVDALLREHNSKYPPNLQLYNRVINVYAQAGDRMKAVEWFEDLKRKGLEPNSITYNTLLRAEARNGTVKSAGTVLRMMIKRGVKPDIYTFTALIDSFGRHGELDKAIDVFMMLRDQQVGLNAKTYNVLLTLCFRNDNVNLAASVFKDMQRAGIEPDTVTYNLLIRGFGTLGDLQRMWKVYEMMQSSTAKPDVHTFIPMLVSFVTHGRFTLAEELFKQCLTLPVRREPHFYNRYAEVLLERGKPEMALEVMNKMRSLRVRQSFTTVKLKKRIYDALPKDLKEATDENTSEDKKIRHDGFELAEDEEERLLEDSAFSGEPEISDSDREQTYSEDDPRNLSESNFSADAGVDEDSIDARPKGVGDSDATARTDSDEDGRQRQMKSKTTSEERV
mmetsp:Transcript_2893/g.8847  ORF Transcript_2893/g.8847 Transcript_2893/m.8847 type:complete len:610 (-) Transcript_2893:106-1935(-)|eukprot:CAMPEP_0198732976 /NCGR_PEP_ID=MMETSP1475-20131203/41537_1 /TAXON_ID= ORGANISM="Unidentified sp., Strain CCMP1999" /NCGR_SAMPLE_ID=MMETSP1475 /ASSEMBLY_ACC=CAM_ASM_001111 /LENGTH=609 /DNA_ID=CAMNT_0044496189 /DNA_START=58 /DNA_END=1887 /DNA_ORIENTATION=+